MQSITDIIPAGSILPVCTIYNPDRAVPLAGTLYDCGIDFIEITLRTKDAFTAAENVINECPGMRVGIGTVTEVEQLQRAKEAGARFCVSPGMTERLVSTAEQLNMPYLPGVSTVSEVMAARETGLAYLKFFPAEAAGGLRTLRLFRELFPETMFCPTGGLNGDNAGDYLKLDNVFCVGGSWLAPMRQIDDADWPGIRAKIQQAA